jgi:hypothetical protein
MDIETLFHGNNQYMNETAETRRPPAAVAAIHMVASMRLVAEVSERE